MTAIKFDQKLLMAVHITLLPAANKSPSLTGMRHIITAGLIAIVSGDIYRQDGIFGCNA